MAAVQRADHNNSIGTGVEIDIHAAYPARTELMQQETSHLTLHGQGEPHPWLD
jgi:hypothetical protein